MTDALRQTKAAPLVSEGSCAAPPRSIRSAPSRRTSRPANVQPRSLGDEFRLRGACSRTGRSRAKQHQQTQDSTE